MDNYKPIILPLINRIMPHTVFSYRIVTVDKDIMSDWRTYFYVDNDVFNDIKLSFDPASFNIQDADSVISFKNEEDYILAMMKYG